MFRCSAAVLVLALVATSALAQTPAAGKFPGVGRAATPAEVRAWDIDVRPDFQGLPKGSGSVAKGQEVWDAKCASCHGTFGESNQVFPPIVGGTRPEDAKTGRVALLLKPEQGRTTMMKLSQISTLWDYINRAMPWTNPKTLTVEEVYATTAYILNLAELVPDDFVLSDANIAEVQQRLPNRNGKTTRHGLWDTRGQPDVRASACMRDCGPAPAIVSSLPEHARDAHGNLAEQNRTIGPMRGQQTARASAPAGGGSGDAREVAQRSACLACHGVDNRVVGPSLREIGAKYRAAADVEAKLVQTVKAGGVGNWGQVPMPPQGHVKDEDIATVVRWILGGLK
jgi:S-disulfanyl-L-cysteine oxidoreductase SoxD